ncbi:hypothetical protein ABGT15_13125 [Flavobacterium enshiense]
MKKLILISFCFLLISCKESIVKFSEAQPENSRNLKSFPGKLIGNYYDLENDTELEISKYLITKKLIFKDTFNIKELSKSEILRNDSVINIKTLEKFSVKRISDSLFTNYIYTDTIFNINEENILRKTKGHYFLSSKDSENSWSVKKLSLKNGQLNLNNISTNEEIELLEEITETKKDTAKPFVVKPTKKQFKEFVKRNGFTEGEIYLKK